jgi:hypothetical protein
MYLPVPKPEIQDEVAEVEGEARTEARAIKLAAEATGTEAKQRFGDDLIDASGNHVGERPG